MAIKAISVTQLNEYISKVLKMDPLLANVQVKGETSSVKYHQNGFIYFTLKDDGSKINCAYDARRGTPLPFKLVDGMEVNLTAFVNLYVKNGSYSLYVKNINLEGEGALQIAFENLKRKLNEEGLFDQSHKRTIPSFPQKIGIVTSSNAAALRDILKNIKTRNDFVDILIFPVLVQGNGAADEIINAIEVANSHFSDLNLLIVGRGGGAYEDLVAFNDESLARAIYASEIPIISAVGHEIDFTIADFVADLRAETPTKAGIDAVPDTGLIRDEIEKYKFDLIHQLSNTFNYNLLKAENILHNMKDSVKQKIEQSISEIEKLKISLEYNNPANILSGGYSVLESKDGHIIKDANDLNIGENYKITLSKGSAECVVTNKWGEINEK